MFITLFEANEMKNQKLEKTFKKLFLSNTTKTAIEAEKNLEPNNLHH